MKHFLYTTMFAFAAAMGVCPAGEETHFPPPCDAPAALECWVPEVVRTENGVYECRICVFVRAAGRQVPDISKFSVRVELAETGTSNRMRGEVSEEASQVKIVKMDASRLRWQKTNPDWSDGGEWFEISFPVAIMEGSMIDPGVTLFYDGVDISRPDTGMGDGSGLEDGGTAYD